MKRCCKCKVSQTIDLFSKNRSSKNKDGYSAECKACIKERKAKYYLQNKDRLYKVDKDRKDCRRKVDLNFRLAGNMRSRLRMAIVGNQKSGSAIADLGCNITFLRTYLEKQFKSGMSWTNYGNKKGNWSIDHIKPLSRFDLSKRQELLIACHYTNLQPLWMEENLRKGNKHV